MSCHARYVLSARGSGSISSTEDLTTIVITQNRRYIATTYYIPLAEGLHICRPRILR